jgi:hypothetical protein
MPISAPSAVAADPKTGMTLDEISELITAARDAGCSGEDVLTVTTTGFIKPRIKTAQVTRTYR